MLTESDLEQLGRLLDERLEAKLTAKFGELEAKIDAKLEPLKKDIHELRQGIVRIEQKLDQAQEDIAEILLHLDHEHTALEKRVEKIEAHLGLRHS